jgi:hypothetical protein
MNKTKREKKRGNPVNRIANERKKKKQQSAPHFLPILSYLYSCPYLMHAIAMASIASSHEQNPPREKINK